ncbi:glycosyltransferase family 9 protein [Acidobacteria bacterium AB60]|nr:glycosyltransferase family 9 protein [Acidobacteria bacterium AB60]
MYSETSVRKVLIYRLGSLGDTVVALPCFHLIARAFPNATRVLLSNYPVHAKAPASAAVLDGSGLVHGYMRYTVGTRDFGELLRLMWAIRRFRPDVLVYVMPLRGEKAVKRDALFFRLCGVRRLIGLPSGDTAEKVYDRRTDLWELEASRLLRCLRTLGEEDVTDLRNWDLLLTEAEVANAERLMEPVMGRPIIACGPGTKMQSKDWGPEKWRGLLARLSAEFPQHGLALIGAKEDHSVSEYASSEWKGAKVNLCGALSPRESAAVIRRAQLFLGPDSGPMHLAAAYGIPCVIPFASLDLKGRWFPVGEGHQPIYRDVACSNCRLQVCVDRGKICINSITVEEMFVAAVHAIAQKESLR